MKRSVLMLCLSVGLAACGGEPPQKSGGGNNRATNNGATNNGATNNGAPNNGATNNGATNNASTNNGASNNTTGCTGCLQGDECVPGGSPVACGFGGAVCAACADGWACFDGECVQPPDCTPDTCEGCCDAVRGCVTGDEEAACGFDGAACQACTGSETCDNGECIGSCADTCAGCCVGEVCQVGTADDSCGVAGAACVDCGTGSSCDQAGSCVSDACATSCGGCCNGETCETGTGVTACGSGGDVCEACGNGRTCVNQECVVSPTARWELVLVSGTVSSTNHTNESWDYIGLPDPVVDFELFDASTNTSYRNSSSVISDDTTPTWNESQLTNVPASAFLSWKIDVWDSDIDPDDLFCSMDYDLDPQSAEYAGLFSGAVYTFSCDDPVTGVFAEIDVRLQPN